MTVLLDGIVHVHYGSHQLGFDGETPDLMQARTGQVNGLCGGEVPRMLSMITGLHTGAIPFRIELHQQTPAVADGWEEVVEASIDIPDVDMTWWAFDEGGPVRPSRRVGTARATPPAWMPHTRLITEATTSQKSTGIPTTLARTHGARCHPSADQRTRRLLASSRQGRNGLTPPDAVVPGEPRYAACARVRGSGRRPQRSQEPMRLVTMRRAYSSRALPQSSSQSSHSLTHPTSG
ncbi:MAG: hypothetical protein U0Q19_09535 [Kineosporiaceae bacterium]